jgi:hypothetical protein
MAGGVSRIGVLAIKRPTQAVAVQITNLKTGHSEMIYLNVEAARKIAKDIENQADVLESMGGASDSVEAVSRYEDRAGKGAS